MREKGFAIKTTDRQREGNIALMLDSVLEVGHASSGYKTQERIHTIRREKVMREESIIQVTLIPFFLREASHPTYLCSIVHFVSLGSSLSFSIPCGIQSSFISAQNHFSLYFFSPCLSLLRCLYCQKQTILVPDVSLQKKDKSKNISNNLSFIPWNKINDS